MKAGIRLIELIKFEFSFANNFMFFFMPQIFENSLFYEKLNH